MQSTVLSPREIRRYGKQIMLPEIGIEGQEKIKLASVAVVGAGGLGCPVLQYLTAAGIGKLGLIEFDRVDETNLQRQILYGTLDIGKLKSVIARERLTHLNTGVEVDVKSVRLSESNALQVLESYDIIVDATDNYEARYVIDDACTALGKPMVHGSIYRYEGLVSVFNFRGGPTYRFYNPGISGSAATLNPLPRDVGLIGVLPGITGIYMANEVLKIVTGTGEVLSGLILHFNIMKNSFRIIRISQTPGNIQKI